MICRGAEMVLAAAETTFRGVERILAAAEMILATAEMTFRVAG